MRVVVERETGAARLEFGEMAGARRSAGGDDVAVFTDAAGHVVGVEIRGVDPAALESVTVELGSGADASVGAQAPHAAPRPAASPAPAREAPPVPHTGPVGWDPEAEAAVAQVPFFSRGQHRLAAVALARRRGLDRVTAEIVRSIGR